MRGADNNEVGGVTAFRKARLRIAHTQLTM